MPRDAVTTEFISVPVYPRCVTDSLPILTREPFTLIGTNFVTVMALQNIFAKTSYA